MAGVLFWTEPPMLLDISDDEICHFAEEPFKSDLPSNTQFLELLVQTVSSYGDAAADPKVRDGEVKSALYTRKTLPKRETKKDFSNLDAF